MPATVTRTFTRFSQAAAENGRSRIYLGIHGSFDDTNGEAMGRQIAVWVVTQVAEPIRPHRHHPAHPRFDDFLPPGSGGPDVHVLNFVRDHRDRAIDLFGPA